MISSSSFCYLIIYYYYRLSQEEQLQTSATTLKADVGFQNPILKPFFIVLRHELIIS